MNLKEKYAPPPSQFVELLGMKVHFRVEGQGPSLVLLHGTASSLHTWQGWVDRLKDHFRIIRLDLPAFGLTGPHPRADYSIKAYVDFLQAFLQSQQIENCFLAGNSLGGHIAWEYALAHPQQVKKLILIDSSGHPDEFGKKVPWIFQLARTPLIGDLIPYISPRFIFRMNLRQVYFDKSKVTPELVTRYFELARNPGNRKAFVQRARQPYQTDFPKLPQLKIPIQLMWGEADAWIPVEQAKDFQQVLPQAELHIYLDAGHVPMEEIPERTAEDALAFLQK